MQRVRVTLVPLVLAASAFFLVLPRSGGDATLRIVREGDGHAYAPAALELEEGARILVENETDATHTVTAVTGEFDLELQPGASRFLEVRGPGRFEYYCRYHGATEGMTGTLTLGDPAAEPSPSGSVSPVVTATPTIDATTPAA